MKSKGTLPFIVTTDWCRTAHWIASRWHPGFSISADINYISRCRPLCWAGAADREWPLYAEPMLRMLWKYLSCFHVHFFSQRDEGSRSLAGARGTICLAWCEGMARSDGGGYSPHRNSVGMLALHYRALRVNWMLRGSRLDMADI
jgi:hypothetical protein